MNRNGIPPDLVEKLKLRRDTKPGHVWVTSPGSNRPYQVEEEFAHRQHAQTPQPYMPAWMKYYKFTDNVRRLFYRGRDITLRQIFYTKQVHCYSRETMELSRLGPWIESEENLPQGSLAHVDSSSELFGGVRLPGEDFSRYVEVENSSISGDFDLAIINGFKSEITLKHCIVEDGLPLNSFCKRYYRKILTPQGEKDRGPEFKRQGPETMWGFF